ncbi:MULTISPECIES: hypothetical protein [Halomonadaceae]|uniref:Uncharacterized protein n=1 Tax=Vreelandella maris TaxID=2729617 RepID=A0A7Y6VAH3_9GAMM|nr:MULTISPECIES: hypothetical protein [Halomonas]EHA16563.1 hypothetical protein HAL1_05798 [Halomonas sp. HAL1]NVF16633.1 hypothetical protein [Halomonas maris]WKV93288.1 hypothetical protein Q3Y66_01220 [Halomonas sp. HAL1]|tara:strand:+ start:1074 stop:1457 length:384 start_codon:yes stop_codon:yes gene_type:complete
MHRDETSIILNDLIYYVIPNLNSAEKLVLSTLESLSEAATNPLDILKRTDQRQAFGLETHRIRINLEHLLNRYRTEVDAILRSEGEYQGPVVEPDPQEADAIRSAKEIYQHVCAFQRGERPHPIPGR